MAAIPPPPPLQQQGMASLMPAQHTASFAQLFAIESSDPHSGEYTQLLEPFNLNINNNPPNMDPATVRSLLATAGHHRTLLAMGIFVNGKMHIFFLPFKQEQGLGAVADPSIDGKLFALDGELIHNTASTVEIDPSVFHQINNQVLVCTLDSLKTELAGNNDPAVMVGPFTTGDADTEAVLVCKCTPLPNKYVSLFMAEGDGVCPRYFFDTVLPVMEADGTDAACLPLIRYFHVALTRWTANSTTAEYLNVARPAPVASSSRLINHVQDLIYHHFPQCNPPQLPSQLSSASPCVLSPSLSNKRKDPLPAAQPPESKKSVLSLASQVSKDLGEYIARDVKLLQQLGWHQFVKQRRPHSDFSNLANVHHPARRLLQHYKSRGAPVKFSTPPWSSSAITRALHRGPHKSCHEYVDFLREEFTDMIAKGQWVVLPASVAQTLPGLRLSPPGVVPQRDRRPRWIGDYSWWGVNSDTLPLAAREAM